MRDGKWYWLDLTRRVESSEEFKRLPHHYRDLYKSATKIYKRTQELAALREVEVGDAIPSYLVRV